MRYSFFLLILLFSCQEKGEKSTYEYVDPFIGTGGHGHTYPGATLPFGMVQLSPDSRLEGWDGCSGYHYSDSVIHGFSHTHLSGTGVSDYGDLLIMPMSDNRSFTNAEETFKGPSYSSLFKKENEMASPAYYTVYLEEPRVEVELTATQRVGIHKYTFEADAPTSIIMDLEHRDKVIDHSFVEDGDQLVLGSRISQAWAQEQHFYFAAEFSSPILKRSYNQDSTKVIFDFDLKKEALIIKVGISAVSMDGALKNLRAEAEHWDFDKYRQDSRKQWETELEKIKVETADEQKKTIFYSAMYHSMIAPNLFSDVDGKYRGMDLKIHESDKNIYTVFSLWDTFRATHPLFTLIQQERNSAFIQSMLSQYQSGGELPIWELSANYTGCMIGYHSIPVIVDAYRKGDRSFDPQLAMEAMLKSARNDKLGLVAYKSKGYIASGDEAESVSKNLEYSYDDGCIALMAKDLGMDEVYKEFAERAQFYQNLFNPDNGFMQSKLNAAFANNFDPAEVNFNFTEANSWQYSLFVPQDIQGLIRIYGGPEGLEKQLDDLFSTEMVLSGRHQADITGLIGQYAHGNEPSHHMAYLYNYIGKAHKTQFWTNKILEEQYTIMPDGLSGNEDCGQMSAWYVLSSMGIYAVSPGSTEYAIGSPQFDKVVLTLENGNTFTIECKGRSKENTYIRSAQLNGQSLTQAFIDHESIMNGGELIFEMSDEANEDWGSEIRPSSFISEEDRIVAVPYLKSEGQTFIEKMTVELAHIDPEVSLYYSLNEAPYALYSEAIELSEHSEIRFYAEKNGKKSRSTQASFKKIKGGRSISIDGEYSNQYAAGGDNALIDYLRGANNFRTGYWQGYYGEDVAFTVDLGEITKVNELSIGALQDIKSWIWFPPEVEFLVSKDGKSFTSIHRMESAYSDTLYGSYIQEFTLPSKYLSEPFRYVKVKARNYGECPEWHLGAGNPSWIFFDEITIE